MRKAFLTLMVVAAIGLSPVVDDFVPRLVKDPMLGKYFVHAQDTLMHIRQLAGVHDLRRDRRPLRLHRTRHEDRFTRDSASAARGGTRQSSIWSRRSISSRCRRRRRMNC